MQLEVMPERGKPVVQCIFQRIEPCKIAKNTSQLEHDNKQQQQQQLTAAINRAIRASHCNTGNTAPTKPFKRQRQRLAQRVGFSQMLNNKTTLTNK